MIYFFVVYFVNACGFFASVFWRCSAMKDVFIGRFVINYYVSVMIETIGFVKWNINIWILFLKIVKFELMESFTDIIAEDAYFDVFFNIF